MCIRDSYGSQEVAEEVEDLLTEMGEKTVEPLIEYGLKSEDPWVVRHAVTALGNIGDERAIKPMIEYGLKHDNENVVEKTALMLTFFEKKSMLPHLMKVVGHDNEFVNSAAKLAIKRLQNRHRE